jgi:SAM-dependent methyltransferase
MRDEDASMHASQVAVREVMTAVSQQRSPSASAIAQFWGAVYDELAANYDTWATPLSDALVSLVNVEAGMRVLDVGCGPGPTLAAGLRRTGSSGSVVGVDVSAEMVSTARRLVRGPNVGFELADVCALPFPDGTFDAVTASLCLFLLGDPEQALREIRRVLHVGGRLGFSVFADTVPEAGLIETLLERLPPQTLDGRRLVDDAYCRALLGGVGFTDVRATRLEHPRVSTIPVAVTTAEFLVQVQEVVGTLPSLSAAEAPDSQAFRLYTAARHA